MLADIRQYIRSCLVCASRKCPGRINHPPLQPIVPHGRSRGLVASDVLRWEPVSCGLHGLFHEMATVFIVPNQRAETITCLLVEHVIPYHGLPEQLLSD
jgi:hypothetical protein